jgi:signal peptidase I
MQIKFYGYGLSMYPTLKPGDLLEVVCREIISVGDVVVYPSIDGSAYIAHRVISICSAGVTTRGDNVDSVDLRLLQFDEITGVVISVYRGTRTILIRGGKRGIVYAKFLWKTKPVYKRLIKYFCTIARVVYRWLSDSAVFRSLIPFKIKPRVVIFNKPDGLEMQLLLGRRVIGRRISGNDNWQLRPPFRLFVDESSLP